MSYHEKQHALYLWGGRRGWCSPDYAPLRDMWRLNLHDLSWSVVAGAHPRLRDAGPAAMHGNLWTILEPSPTDGAPSCLRVFNVQTRVWGVIGGDKSNSRQRRKGKKQKKKIKKKIKKKMLKYQAPPLAAPCAGWYQEGKMFFYAPERRQDSDKTSSFAECGVWQVNIDTGTRSFMYMSMCTTLYICNILCIYCVCMDVYICVYSCL